MTEHGDCRHIICYLGVLVARYRLAVLAEKYHHYRYRKDSAQLDREEHAEASVHPEEIIEVHIVRSREHD